MTRATLRELLRRQVNEVDPDDWDDTQLNDLLNYGAHQVQKEILKVDKLAFMFRDLRHIDANEDLVDKPQGMWYEWRLEKKDASTGVYKRMRRKDYTTVRDVVELPTDDQGTVYSNIGRWFALTPTPTVSITNGLRIWYMPTLDMSDDTDVSPIHQALHPAIVLEAKLLAMGETSEAATPVLEALAHYVADIPAYYTDSLGDNESLVPDRLHQPVSGSLSVR